MEQTHANDGVKLMAGFLAGLGAGLQDLGQGLTQYQMRKLAEEEQQRKEARQREQDALAKAAMAQDEFMAMDKSNFKRVGSTKNKGDYNALLASSLGTLNPKAKLGESTSSAFDGDRVTGAISGDEYVRGAGQSPNDQARMLKELAEQNKRDLAAAKAQSAAELLAQREAGLNSRWGTASGNTIATQEGANRRWDTVAATPKYVSDNTQAGADRRSQNALEAMMAGGGPMTEGARQASVFSALMQAADSELEKNPWGTQPFHLAQEIGLKGDGKGLTGNLTAAAARKSMSPEQQRAYQSRLQFTRAAVYAFSGKAVTEREAADNVATFFPQSGETDPSIVDQKKRSRALAEMLLSRRKAGEVLGELPIGATPLDMASPIGGNKSGSALDALKNMSRKP